MAMRKRALWRSAIFAAAVAAVLVLPAEASRWLVTADGSGIEWNVAGDKRLGHSDFIEMSGLRVSLECTYSVAADRTLSLSRKLYWPGFRKQPNDTYGTLTAAFKANEAPSLCIDGKPVGEKLRSVSFDGVLEFLSEAGDGIAMVRRVFPSAANPAAYEVVSVTNTGAKAVRVTVGADAVRYLLGCDGRYEVAARLRPAGETVLEPGKGAVWTLSFTAHRVDRAPAAADGLAELAARRRRVAEIVETCVLETGDTVLDTMFRLSKVRAAESIFATRGGLMHSPGGRTYYAGTWCNDQVEYAGPWFAFTGDGTALEASLNAYCHYMPFMAPDYAPIPSSVIAEGFDYWNGVGDRGDAAMWAYGATRFVLASGRRDWAERLLPGIRWTLEYCRRKVNAQGVVASNTDELEGRLPSGSANLCTSALCYDALRHASILMRELGQDEDARGYAERAHALGAAIERHFGADIHGFRTYRYYEGCKVLRSWIGIPLTMGMYDRADGTAAALFSPHIWTGGGMLSAEGDSKGITWDRSALYAFRGLLAAGKTKETMPKLLAYSRARLLGEHVPYAVEAWPEGGRRHLSAESALYCRIFVEGLFGLDPAGFGKFDVKPHLPSGWNTMRLRHVRAFGKMFSITVSKNGTQITEEE